MNRLWLSIFCLLTLEIVQTAVVFFLPRARARFHHYHTQWQREREKELIKWNGKLIWNWSSSYTHAASHICAGSQAFWHFGIDFLPLFSNKYNYIFFYIPMWISQAMLVTLFIYIYSNGPEYLSFRLAFSIRSWHFYSIPNDNLHIAQSIFESNMLWTK